MVETLEQFRRIFDFFQSQTALFHNPVVVIIVVALYFGGCMLYVVFACRRHGQQDQSSQRKKITAAEPGKNVRSDERC